MRSYLKFGIFAAALIAMSASIASAANLGIQINGDIEAGSRFLDWGPPGLVHPNGYPDGWHSGPDASWSDPNTDPTTSPVHSLKMPDASVASPFSEYRSFARNLSGVGSARVLTVSWKWNWDITGDVDDPNDVGAPPVFTGTIRISTSATGGSLDLGGAITDHFYFTDGSASSGGYDMFMTTIALGAADASYDIIFNTGDRTLGDANPAKFGLEGTMFVDDVSASIPEPASLLLLSISGLMVMGRRQRG